jgi:hypothetical protein
LRFGDRLEETFGDPVETFCGEKRFAPVAATRDHFEVDRQAGLPIEVGQLA